MHRKNQVVIVTLLALVLIIVQSRAQNVTANRKADKEDIYALVIRSQMEEWIRGGDKREAEAKDASDKAIAKQLNFSVFFVSIDGEDPSDAFMKRFDDLPRTIRKASSEVPNKGVHTPEDKSTGKAGIIFHAEKLQWHNKDLVDVQAGYYCGGTCAAGITFTVKRENSKWMIKSSHMNPIS
jgi:hypothetical protein